LRFRGQSQARFLVQGRFRNAAVLRATEVIPRTPSQRLVDCCLEGRATSAELTRRGARRRPGTPGGEPISSCTTCQPHRRGRIVPVADRRCDNRLARASWQPLSVPAPDRCGPTSTRAKNSLDRRIHTIRVAVHQAPLE
jgi:hypothetical protein